LIECFVREAEYMASLTISFLEVMEILPVGQRREHPVAIPAEFLTELAAILRISIWELNNLRDQIAADLPRAEDAYNDLMERAYHRPESFSSPGESPPLHYRVMEAVLRHLAWNGRRDLGADVLLGRPDDGDDDAALEAMAQYLWARRHSGGERPRESREAVRG
jgi:hypothetical protein